MDGFNFYRPTRRWGEGNTLIQAGNRGDPRTNFPPIAHEPTTKTGLTNCDGALAVSYTHLDVYKRQAPPKRCAVRC